MEQQIKLANKLYQCRDAVKKLYGKEWKEAIAFHSRLIKACMLKHNIDNEVKAAMHLADEYKHMTSSSVFNMKVLAAAVEIIEPTKD